MGESTLGAQVKTYVLSKTEVFPKWGGRTPFPGSRKAKIDGHYQQVGRYNPEKAFDKKCFEGDIFPFGNYCKELR